MTKNLTHIFLTLTASACALLTGCTGNVSDMPEPIPGKEDAITLRLDVSVLGDANSTTRASFPNLPDDPYENPATGYEKLQTLRVIIVDSLGHIEHNRMVKIDDQGNPVKDNLLFDISVPWVDVPDGVGHFGIGHKQIWLFGNEKAAEQPMREAFLKAGMLSQDNLNKLEFVGVLDLLKEGYEFCPPLKKTDTSRQWAADALRNTVLTRNDAGFFINNSGEGSTCSYIPMSEVFDVDVNTANAEVNSAGTSYTVTESLFITRSLVKFTFSAKYGDSDSAEEITIKEIAVTNMADKGYYIPSNTVYNPAKGVISTNPLGGRLITGFSAPSDAVKSQFSFIPPSGADDSFKVLPQEPDYGKRNVYVPYLYFPETHLSDGETFDILVKAIIRNEITGADDEVTFDAVPLTNLPQMPRNTHVYVNMIFDPYGIRMEAVLLPYTGVYLDPEFGIDRPQDQKNNNTGNN